MRKKSGSRTIARDPSELGVVVSPGEMLLEEFIRPLGLKQPALAAELGVSLNRLNEIVLGKRGITADTAIRLARRFKMSPQFWMRLQADWDLAQEMVATKKPADRRKKRSLFAELMTGVEAMTAHREGRVTLKTRHVQPIAVPPVEDGHGRARRARCAARPKA